MKVFKGIVRVIKNKYVITVLVMASWLLFFDRNDVFSQYDRHKEVKKLEQETEYYRNEIANNRKEENELKSNQKLVEKFGRERYLMKKDNEEIYLLVPDTLK
jgi:cell division protein FtsB